MANRRNKHRKPQVKSDYKPPFAEELLSEPVSELKLREDTAKLLSAANLNTLYDLAVREEKDFYRIHTFNKKNLNDVKNALRAKKMFIKPTPEKVEEKKPDVKEDGNKNNQHEKGGHKTDNGNHNQRNGVANADTLHKGKKDLEKAHKGEGQYIMITRPPKPPRPKIQPVKEEPDIYVKVNKGGKWGFKDRNGKQVVEAMYDEVFAYKDNMCCVEKDEKFGFINRQGEQIIPLEYDCATSFSEGYACVFRKDKCGYIDSYNGVVVDFKFDAGTPVIGGECRVKKDGKWGEMHLTKDDDNNVIVSDIRWIT